MIMGEGGGEERRGETSVLVYSFMFVLAFIIFRLL